MATLSSEKYQRKNGKTVSTYRIVIKRKNKRSHAIRLGPVTKQQAEIARNRVNSLESAQKIGCAIDADTAAWLSRIEDGLYDKLVKAELVPPRQRKEQVVLTLGQHLEKLFTARQTIKKSTRRNEMRSRRLLEKYFGIDRTLASITPGDGDDYKNWLLRKYAVASASVDLRRAKEYLDAAHRHRLIQENPFADLTCGAQTNEERIEFIDRETIDRVIAACPDIDWQLIFAFARYGGTRIPSEIEDLTWSDVDWDKNRFTLHAKKVEHHPGRKYRTVPIFSALRPYLERAYQERGPGAVYVIPRAHGGPNMGTGAIRIIKKAGVKPWEKTFVNLRGSCSDELERTYPSHVVDAWIGNSSLVRRRHYLKVTDDDFKQAAGYPSPYPSPSAAVSSVQEPSTLDEAREKALDVPENAADQYPRQGSNLRPRL